MADKTWKVYYEQAGMKPSSIVTMATEYLSGKDAALDLGSGNGRDSIYLNKLGFGLVVAVDSSPEAPNWLPPGIASKRQTIEDFLFNTADIALKERYDLVICVNTLFFLKKDAAYRVLARMFEALKPQGIMAFNILGEEDDWAKFASEDHSFFGRDEVRALKSLYPLADKEKTCSQVRKPDGTLANGAPHYWHYFNLICRKAA